jgi:hypothetical protein
VRGKVKRKDIWSTCYWCRNNFCTVRKMDERGRFREAPKLCGDRCESLSRRWDMMAQAGGLTSSKYGYAEKYSLSTLKKLVSQHPCGHERTPDNTYSHAGRDQCLSCRRRRARIGARARAMKNKMKEAA